MNGRQWLRWIRDHKGHTGEQLGIELRISAQVSGIIRKVIENGRIKYADAIGILEEAGILAETTDRKLDCSFAYLDHPRVGSDLDERVR